MNALLEIVDRKGPPLLEREDEDSTAAPATQQKSMADIETSLSTVHQKLIEERALTSRLKEWIRQDQHWFSEEQVRTQCLGERLQFFISENASLRNRVKHLEHDKISMEEEASTNLYCVLHPSCKGSQE